MTKSSVGESSVECGKSSVVGAKSYARSSVDSSGSTVSLSQASLRIVDPVACGRDYGA